MIKLIVISLLSIIWGSLYASEPTYSFKLCNKAQEDDSFTDDYYYQTDSFYDLKNEVIELISARAKALELATRCFEKDQDGEYLKQTEQCLFLRDYWKENIQENVFEMNVSLMVWQGDAQIFHPYQKTKNIYITKSQNNSYEKIIAKRMGNDPLKPFLQRSISDMVQHKKKKQGVIDDYRIKYFLLAGQNPHLIFIDPLLLMSDEDLAIKNSISKLAKTVAQLSQGLLRLDDEELLAFIGGKQALEYFLFKTKRINKDVCDFAQETHEQFKSLEFLAPIKKVAPMIVTSIASCFLLSPIGCLFVTGGLGVITSRVEYNGSSNKIAQSEDKLLLKLGTNHDISSAYRDHSQTLLLMPLNLLEIWGIFRFFKLSKFK